MFNRTFISLLCAAAGVLAPTAALTGSAAARTPSIPSLGNKYLVYIKGTQTTTSDAPVHATYSDCYHVYSGESHASETISFHTTAPDRAVIAADGPMAMFTWGWNPLETLFSGAMRSTLERHSRSVQYDRAGRCGGGGPTKVTKGSDCGTLRPDWAAEIAFPRPGRVEIQAVDGVEATARSGFDDCPITAPAGRKGLNPVAGQLTDVTASLPLRKLRRNKKGGTIVVNASESFAKCLPGGEWQSCHQQVKWQLRLLRVR